MQNIIEVKQNWPDNLLRVGIVLGNYCNYKCWYCWPGSNDGTMKFPDVDLIIKNLSYTLDYYKEHTNKTKFDITLLGGEPTHWPQFIKFVSYFKDNYNCIITLKTNGSKKLDWWAKAAPYLDHVGISIHHEFVDVDHVVELADYLYSQNVPVVAQVMMDPRAWDTCMANAEYFKGSKYQWPIRFAELIDVDISYTEEQRNIIDTVRLRGNNWLWYVLHNRSYRSKVTVIDENSKPTVVSENYILLNKLNEFNGWQCNLGVDWICIAADGDIIGFCPNNVYNNDVTYNIYSDNFVEEFQPTIEPVTCNQLSCVCVFDTNMPKKKVANTQKRRVITIKELK